MDAVYNQSDSISVILDNRIHWYDHHQENPGTGFMGKPAPEVDIPA